jgi:hypothetical protein
MSGYMPQRVFNAGALAIAILHLMNGMEIEKLVAKLAEGYRRSFKDDKVFEEELIQATIELINVFSNQFPREQLSSAFHQLQFCAVNYDRQGKKIRKKIFGGTIFTKVKKPNPTRIQDCVRDMIIYHTFSMNGHVPLAPDGWSLENW